MTYGILASKSYLLKDIVDQFYEDSKKVNSVERLTRHLNKGTSLKALHSYLSVVRKWVPKEPVIHIDDSDVVKPDGHKFEALGLVRDGSRSTVTKNVYEKGYHVTEACVLSKNNHPVSIFSEIHSSKEKNFTSSRKLLYHNKWTMATELCNRRKGKVRTNVIYRGKNHEAYLSYVKVQITTSRTDICLILVYGITEHPVMLAANKELRSKEDVVRVARTYFSRWKIEEYFRCKNRCFSLKTSGCASLRLSML